MVDDSTTGWQQLPIVDVDACTHLENSRTHTRFKHTTQQLFSSGNLKSILIEQM